MHRISMFCVCVCVSSMCVCECVPNLRLFLLPAGAEPMILLDATERGAVWRGAAVVPEREARDTCMLPWACWTMLLLSKDTLSSLL